MNASRTKNSIVVDDHVANRTTVVSVPRKGFFPFQLLGHPNHHVGNCTISLNGDQVFPFQMISFRNGDVLTIASKQMQTHGSALATDEMEFVIQLMRACSKNHVNISDILFAQEDLFDIASYEVFFQFCEQRFVKKEVGTCPILHENHWALIELRWDHENNKLDAHFINTPANLSHLLIRVLHKAAIYCNKQVSVAEKIVPVDEGYCGWAIIHRWLADL